MIWLRRISQQFFSIVVPTLTQAYDGAKFIKFEIESLVR